MWICERCENATPDTKWRNVNLRIQAAVCDACWKGDKVELTHGLNNTIKYHLTKIKEYEMKIKEINDE